MSMLKISWRWRVLLLAIVVTGASITVLVLPRSFRQYSRAADRRQVHLLCDTDYDELLKACRGLSRRVASGELKARQYNVRRDLDTETASFPKIILDLKPSYVLLRRETVTIEMFGAFHYFGVSGLAEDYVLGPSGKAGDIELIPGLWYYDTEYDEYAEYRQRIESLVSKGRVYNRSRKKLMETSGGDGHDGLR